MSTTTTLSEDEKRQRLSTLLSLFETAMLVTRTGGGGMRARPLSIAESQDDGAMYFSTAIDSPKVHELEADPHVNVVMQDARRFVSLSGTATVVRDRALIERLWRPSWKVWFPQGKDDLSAPLVLKDMLRIVQDDRTPTVPSSAEVCLRTRVCVRFEPE